MVLLWSCVAGDDVAADEEVDEVDVVLSVVLVLEDLDSGRLLSPIFASGMGRCCLVCCGVVLGLKIICVSEREETASELLVGRCLSSGRSSIVDGTMYCLDPTC